MRWRYTLFFVGILSVFLGLTMIIPFICSIITQDNSARPILFSAAITETTGLLLFFGFRIRNHDHISSREGIAIVALGWIAAGFFSALPFYFGNAFDTFTDAFFESVSGITTTGASVMTNIEGVSSSLLLWRSFIQWLGGMGIIVLSLAILPLLGVGGMQMYKAEVPSPIPDKLKPRIRDTAMILWKVYAGITIAEVLFLLMGGMSFYDALNHALTTMPTGGFSTKNLSVAHYNSVYIETVIIVFMMLAGINFSLHYQMLLGKPLAFWKDSECRFFLSFVLIVTLIVTINIFPVYDSFGKAFRYASFQVVSIVTTTGYGSADYELWPGMSQMILLLCMFIGASAGSTGGGMKCLRIMIYFKYCYKELISLIHPRAVSRIKVNGQPVSPEVVSSVLGFLGLFVGLFAISSVMLAAMGVDLVTAFSAVASAIGNIGPGLGTVGPTENYASLPAMGKWLLVWCMLLGRLEIYTIIILLIPEFWRK
ncbi:potassium uptake protein, TrkH family [Candidatus Magnetomorum sp. HK-1]|nr:potassium uptake protein, TrkH family [Candidatus Magnetomorum sp. HK-1]